jgi:hypothetical protein
LQLSNDPTLSSLPLLSTFLKSYSRPYLGIVPPAAAKQVSASSESTSLSEEATKEANGINGSFPGLTQESDELIEKDIRDRFKKMCEGYFDSVCKKLVIEHNVSCWMMPVISCNGSPMAESLCIAVARARSEKPRGIHPLGGDFRR